MDRRTLCVQTPDDTRGAGRPLAPAIVPAATFEFDSQGEIDAYFDSGRGYLYARYGNPTVRQAEERIARLEGAEAAVCFASGMAAIHTVLSAHTGPGARIAAQSELYGGTAGLLRNVLPEAGVEVVWIDLDDLATLKPSRIAGCNLLFLETPVNPTLRLVDVSSVCAVAREAGVPVAVDATFATPMLQRPIEQGADLVVHSATKYLGGHSDLTGGCVAGSHEHVRRLAERRRLLGGTLDPFAAFLLLRGIRTLAVRMEAHCRAAQAVADGLRRDPRIERVLYPGLDDHPDHELARRQMDGFGGMVSVLVRGGRAAATRLHDGVRLFRRAASLGGVESLISIPAAMSHRHLEPGERERMGVPDHLVRLSVGLEAPDDLLRDLTRALG